MPRARRRPQSPAVLLVSPVSAITSDLKSLPGTNLAFSGRFSGVPLLAALALAPTPPALAAAFASNAAEPSTAVSWMVTHLTCWGDPECRALIGSPSASAVTAAAPSAAVVWKVTGVPLTETWRTCSLPWVRSPACVGLNGRRRSLAA